MNNAPKCDIHRHLGGSISPETVWEIISRSEDFAVATSLEEVRSRMTFDVTAIRTFPIFLEKFAILDHIKWTDWAVELAVHQIVRDLKTEHIEYAALSVSLDKYLKSGLWDLEDIATHMLDCFEAYGEKYGVTVDLLLALPYHAPRENQYRSSGIIKKPRVANRFRGIDLVGNEKYFEPEFYRGLLRPWYEAQKIIRAHVGELPSMADNVQKAVYRLPLTNIAHGIFADSQTLQEANRRGICFDLALHSNHFTGAVEDMDQHPMKKMIELGCTVTLNTDDPIQFGCTLDDEFDLAIRHDLIAEEQIGIIRENAVTAFGPIKSTGG